MKKAIIRRLAVDAAKGDPRAQRLFTTLLTISEEKAQDEAQRTEEQASGPSTFEIVIVDPKAPQADDDSEADS